MWAAGGTIANGAGSVSQGDTTCLSIVHSDEIQPMSGGSSPGGGARPRGEYPVHVGGGSSSLSDFHQCAYHGSYHLFEEAVGIEGEDNELALASEIQLLQSALWVFVVGRRGFKRGEIVRPDEAGCGLRHGFDIEGLIDSPGPLPKQGSPFGSIHDVILIQLALCRVACMKVIGDRFDGKGADVGWKVGI